LLAVWAAILAEIDEEPPVLLRRVGNVLTKIEEARREPWRNIDRVGRGLLRSRKIGHSHRQRQGEHGYPFAHIDSLTQSMEQPQQQPVDTSFYPPRETRCDPIRKC
jgi:hypothetical protein